MCPDANAKPPRLGSRSRSPIQGSIKRITYFACSSYFLASSAIGQIFLLLTVAITKLHAGQNESLNSTSLTWLSRLGKCRNNNAHHERAILALHEMLCALQALSSVSKL